VHDFDEWYASSGRLEGVDVVEAWLHEEECALAEGYAGLRISGNMSFLTPADWPAFMAYEQAITARFSGRRIVTLCSYPAEKCNNKRMGEVVGGHHCAFERPGAEWQVAAVPTVLPDRTRVLTGSRR
jgi:hypothetical protein